MRPRLSSISLIKPYRSGSASRVWPWRDFRSECSASHRCCPFPVPTGRANHPSISAAVHRMTDDLLNHRGIYHTVLVEADATDRTAAVRHDILQRVFVGIIPREASSFARRSRPAPVDERVTRHPCRSASPNFGRPMMIVFWSFLLEEGFEVVLSLTSL